MNPLDDHLWSVAVRLHRRYQDSDVTGYPDDPFTLELYNALNAAYLKGKEEQRIDDEEFYRKEIQRIVLED